MRWTLARACLAAVLVLTVASCSSGSEDDATIEAKSDDSSADASAGTADAGEEFCELARRMDASQTAELGTFRSEESANEALEFFVAEQHALLSDMLDVVPDPSMRPAIEVQLSYLDPESPNYLYGYLDGDAPADGAGSPLEFLADPRFLSAAYRLELYLNDECGIEPSGSIEKTDEGFEVNLDTELSTEGLDDPMSSTEIQAALEAALPAAEILLVTTSVSGDDVVVTVGVRQADPLAVCEAAVEYLDGVTDDDSSAVRIANDPGETLVERTPGETCAAR